MERLSSAFKRLSISLSLSLSCSRHRLPPSSWSASLGLASQQPSAPRPLASRISSVSPARPVFWQSLPGSPPKPCGSQTHTLNSQRGSLDKSSAVEPSTQKHLVAASLLVGSFHPRVLLLLLPLQLLTCTNLKLESARIAVMNHRLATELKNPYTSKPSNYAAPACCMRMSST